MKTEYPSYITNNTQLVLHLLRNALPLNKPMKLKSIIDLVLELTDGIGVYGQPITNSTIRCAVRQKLGTPQSEYKLISRAVYKRIIPQGQFASVPQTPDSPFTPEAILEFAYKIVSNEFQLNPLDTNYKWEDLSTARLMIREILDHIKTARELLEKFPYREMLVKNDEQ